MAESVPAGFSMATLLHVNAEGFNAAMVSWGNQLLLRGGKAKGLWQADFSLRMLGYTTDNGAYYVCFYRGVRERSCMLRHISE